VSSFGHFQGVHYQNLDAIEEYQAAVGAGGLPINRALKPSKIQRLIREFALQLKEGSVDTAALDMKFSVRTLEEFSEPLANQQRAGYLEIDGEQVRLTRKGLLQADSLLPEYFEPEHRRVRYT
ncbi:uncharacterized protein METZ01_LOCUS493397, partial [marine metagenome]